MSYEILDTKFINLNSTNATFLNSKMLSNVIFPFNNILTDDDDILYSKIGVLNAQIPVSWLLINNLNNKLYFKVGTGATILLTMTNGNYSGNSFIAELTRLFLVLGYTFTITLAKNNGLMSFSTSTSFTFYGTGTLLYILGFDFGTDYNSTSNALTAPYALNLLGNKKLKINSQALSTNTFDSLTMGINSNVCTIPINVSSWGLIDFTNNGSNAFSKLNSKTVAMIDIQITNEWDELIDFGGVNWCITLQLDIYRRRTTQEKTLFTNDISNEIVQTLLDIKDELKPEKKTDLNIEKTDETINKPIKNTDEELNILES